VRDYGRNDLAQIRIKKDRLIDPSVPNFYIRGDGTRVYFFEKEQLRDLLEKAPRGEAASAAGEEDASQGMFELSQLGEDKRMVSWFHLGFQSLGDGIVSSCRVTIQPSYWSVRPIDDRSSTGRSGNRCIGSGCRSRRRRFKLRSPGLSWWWSHLSVASHSICIQGCSYNSSDAS